MKLQTLLLITICWHCFVATAQDHKKFVKPDFKTIEKETTDKNSKYYYPVLLYRYKGNDTALSLPDMKMFYFGSFFKATDTARSYFDKMNFNDSIRAIRSKYTIDDDDRRTLIRYYEANYEANPTDLETLNMLYSLYSHLHDRRAADYEQKLSTIFDVISETGDGLSPKTAFYIVTVDDEYAILGMLGYKSTHNQSLLDMKYDLLEVAENDNQVKGLYFNVEQMMKMMEQAINTDDLKKFIDESKDKK